MVSQETLTAILEMHTLFKQGDDKRDAGLDPNNPVWQPRLWSRP